MQFNKSIVNSRNDMHNITAAVRTMVKEKGRTMEADAKEKFEAGIITERQYRVLAELQKREDKDAELG